MKNILRIFSVLLMITSISIAGIKSAKDFYTHNSKAGFRALELKINHSLEVKWNENNSTPVKIWSGLTDKGYAPVDKSNAGLKFLKENKQLFGIKNPKKELRLVLKEQDENGRTIIIYQQEYNGIKIFSTKIALIFNKDGSIESFEGNYFPSPELSKRYNISEETAARNAVNYLDNIIIKSFSSELFLMQVNKEMLPVFLIHVLTSTKNYDVFVNAENGKIIKPENLDSQNTFEIERKTL